MPLSGVDKGPHDTGVELYSPLQWQPIVVWGSEWGQCCHHVGLVVAHKRPQLPVLLISLFTVFVSLQSVLLLLSSCESLVPLLHGLCFSLSLSLSCPPPPTTLPSVRYMHWCLGIHCCSLHIIPCVWNNWLFRMVYTNDPLYPSILN